MHADKRAGFRQAHEEPQRHYRLDVLTSIHSQAKEGPGQLHCREPDPRRDICESHVRRNLTERIAHHPERVAEIILIALEI